MKRPERTRQNLLENTTCMHEMFKKNADSMGIFHFFQLSIVEAD